MNSSDTDLNLKVEILKKKYLERRKRVTQVSDPILSREDGEKPSNHDAISRKNGEKKPPKYRDMKCYDKAVKELLEAVSGQPERLDTFYSISGSEDELSDRTDSLEGINIHCTETDVTLPSNLVCSSISTATDPVWFGREEQRDQTQGLTRSPTPMGQVYQEMVQIYDKLQTERLSQQTWAAELCEREKQLQQRERLLLQHQSTRQRLQGVEGEMFSRINALEQQYQQEIENLRAALKEKTKENKRIKSSFDSIKELNDTVKKQLNEVCEQNRRLENQSQKVQARLDNLQRKYEYGVAHRGRENVASKTFDPKPSKQDRPLPSSKVSKGSASACTVKLLATLLDWEVDSLLVQSEEGKNKGETDQYEVKAPSLHERCSKVLPLLVEQLQQTATTEPSLQLPLLRFTYCALTQLEHSTQPPLTSTLRRLGEEVSRGPGDSNKGRTCPLFRSSCLHTRFLSTLIILKTISQVDILAQALDMLHSDLGTDDGKALFLKYQALGAILSLLRMGNPGLLAPAVDILLQMSADSLHYSEIKDLLAKLEPGLMVSCSGLRYQTAFLEACGIDQFFRCTSLLLRNPRLDLSLVEKLSILLQKLSSIRKNKRLFEASSLHLLLQEMHRTADPAQAFLGINLSSILFNLAMPIRP